MTQGFSTLLVSFMGDTAQLEKCHKGEEAWQSTKGEKNKHVSFGRRV